MNNDPIETLFERLGIPAEYEDVNRKTVRIPREAKEKILSCMGVPLDKNGAQQYLDSLDLNDAIRPLPEVLTARQGEAFALQINLPESSPPANIEVEITGEAGEVDRFSLAQSITGGINSFQSGGENFWSADLELKTSLPPGRHRLSLSTTNADRDIASVVLLVAPLTCYEPEPLRAGKNLFGVMVQLYTLRSERNWGIGDFTDLKNFIRAAAPHGVDLVGLNPLHALFPANPWHYSPYSPSNRSFINVLYIDPEAVPEFSTCEAARDRVNDRGFQRNLADLRAVSQVDYVGASRVKLEVMETLFDYFLNYELVTGSARAAAYQQFVAEQGEALFQHALYEALYEHFLAQDAALWGWPVWPEDYRDPGSAAVAGFAAQNRERVEYYQYLQWCAFEQVQAAQTAALEAGMAVGIYLDLAIGVDQAGSEAWSNQDLYCFECSAGAPPDALAREGQDWGFPPLDPRALQRSAYELFIKNLRASMSCAGAVRYDHAVALLRLWWIPRGELANEGAYVNYDLQQLLSVIALESWRNQCLVIGEDLGTVPDVLREKMVANHLYSYKVLYFEKYRDGGLIPPEEYPQRSVATVTTHDLATLASWWDNSDLDIREALNLLGDEDMIAQIREMRDTDKQLLLDALYRCRLIDSPLVATDVHEMTEELSAAVHLYLASSNASVMISQIEDWLGMLEPINIPGTFDEYPNWQRKVSETIESVFNRPNIQRLCRKIGELRAQGASR